MKQDQKYSFSSALFKNSGGQAAVEYILLCVVIVGIMAVVGKGFKTLDEGVNRYVGDYIICLMEYGELPSLGVQDSNVNRHAGGTGKTCDGRFASFTLDAGRPPVDGGSSTGSTKNPSTTGSTKNSSGDEKSGTSKTDKATDKEASSDKDKSGELAGGGAGKTTPPKIGQTSGRSKTYGTNDGSGDEDSKSKFIEDEGDEEGGKKRRRRNPRRLAGWEQEPYRALNGRAAKELDKLQKRSTSRKPSSTISKMGKDDGNFRPFRKQITPRVLENAGENADDNSGFSYGNILRWLLIAGMIIAIVIFFGGQLLNYSNSDS